MSKIIICWTKTCFDVVKDNIQLEWQQALCEKDRISPALNPSRRQTRIEWRFITESDEDVIVKEGLGCQLNELFSDVK